MMHPSSCRCSAAKLHINCRASSSGSAFQVGTTWGGLDSPGTSKFSGQSMKMTSTPALAFGMPSNRRVFPPDNCACVVYEEIIISTNMIQMTENATGKQIVPFLYMNTFFINCSTSLYHIGVSSSMSLARSSMEMLRIKSCLRNIIFCDDHGLCHMRDDFLGEL